MGKTTGLRRELKRSFFPLLEAGGFAVDLRNAPMFTAFRRVAADSVHLVEVQWDKYGKRRFVINFGKCPAEGLLVRGERFPPGQVYAGWLEEHGRLQPRRGNSSAQWFSQDPTWLRRLLGVKPRSPDAVVEDLLRLFPEVEAFFTSGSVGRHLMMVRIPRGSSH